MAKVTPIDRLGAEIESILNEYELDVNKELGAAVKAAGAAGVKALRASARSTFKSHSDKPYAKSWRVENENVGAGLIVATIYSTKPGLPHLLEYGHANRGGGRTSGKEHIKSVEDALVRDFEKEVTDSL